MSNKYGAKRVYSELCGRFFASKAECKRGEELKLLEMVNVITKLEYQPRFVLCKKPKITYTADFCYLEEIGAKVNGQLPAELWHHWLNSDQELYVVRFKIIELIKEGGKQNARYNRVKYRY